MKTVCLICGCARIETVCGDQSCPCSGGIPQTSMRPLIIEGLGWTRPDGVRVTMQKCGRVVPDAVTRELREVAA